MSMSQIEDWFTGARNRSVRQSKLTSSSSTRNQKIASTSLSSDSTGDSMIDDGLMEKLDDFDYDPPKALGQGEQGIPNPSSTELSKKSISLQNQVSQSGQQTTKALDSHPSAASKTVVKETVTDKSALPGDKTSPKIAQSDGQSNQKVMVGNHAAELVDKLHPKDASKPPRDDLSGFKDSSKSPSSDIVKNIKPNLSEQKVSGE